MPLRLVWTFSVGVPSRQRARDTNSISRTVVRTAFLCFEGNWPRNCGRCDQKGKPNTGQSKMCDMFFSCLIPEPPPPSLSRLTFPNQGLPGLMSISLCMTRASLSARWLKNTRSRPLERRRPASAAWSFPVRTDIADLSRREANCSSRRRRSRSSIWGGPFIVYRRLRKLVPNARWQLGTMGDWKGSAFAPKAVDHKATQRIFFENGKWLQVPCRNWRDTRCHHVPGCHFVSFYSQCGFVPIARIRIRQWSPYWKPWITLACWFRRALLLSLL